jgi:hypothetical protein
MAATGSIFETAVVVVVLGAALEARFGAYTVAAFVLES